MLYESRQPIANPLPPEVGLTLEAQHERCCDYLITPVPQRRSTACASLVPGARWASCVRSMVMSAASPGLTKARCSPGATQWSPGSAAS